MVLLCILAVLLILPWVITSPVTKIGVDSSFQPIKSNYDPERPTRRYFDLKNNADSGRSMADSDEGFIGRRIDLVTKSSDRENAIAQILEVIVRATIDGEDSIERILDLVNFAKSDVEDSMERYIDLINNADSDGKNAMEQYIERANLAKSGAMEQFIDLVNLVRSGAEDSMEQNTDLIDSADTDGIISTVTEEL